MTTRAFLLFSVCVSLSVFLPSLFCSSVCLLSLSVSLGLSPASLIHPCEQPPGSAMTSLTVMRGETAITWSLHTSRAAITRARAARYGSFSSCFMGNVHHVLMGPAGASCTLGASRVARWNTLRRTVCVTRCVLLRCVVLVAPRTRCVPAQKRHLAR